MNSSDWWKKLEEKLEKLDDRLDKTNETLVRNTTSLEEHMKRTALLEQEFRPVKSHVQLMNNLAKIGSAALAGLLAAKSLGLL